MASDAERPGVSSAETIFNAALEVSLAERSAYLARACGDDLQLRRRVEALLRAHEAPGGFLPEEPRTSLIAEAIPTALLAGLPSEQPGDTIGRYKLLQKLGEGGCGVVYMAEQEVPVRRKVALKIIKLGMDTKQVVARFEAERQALALMDHPNIAKVFDAGATETGRPYFVMELVGGIKITDYCEQYCLDTPQRLDLFMLVCHAIQHAHQKGIIHRDIKPSNVLVATQDGVPVPKVIDFGIAKATQGRLTDQTVFTAFEQFLGTPAYMSPEQAQLGSLDVDTRSDIYSLGVLLYELLTSKTPFDSKELLAAGLDAMRRTIQEKEPPTPSTRLKQDLAARSAGSEKSALHTPHSALDKDLDWIVMKCLEKDRTRRYETPSGLALDIERHLNNEPVAAGPPTRIYRLRKVIRRNKLIFTLVSVVAIAVVAGLGVCTQMYLQEKAARKRAVASENKAVAISIALEEQRLRTDEASALISDVYLTVNRPVSDDVDAVNDAIRVVVRPRWGANATQSLAGITFMNGLITLFVSKPDAVMLQVDSWDKRLVIWDASPGMPVFIRWVKENVIEVCKLATGKPLYASLDHQEPVIWADFNEDGTTFVVVCSPDRSGKSYLCARITASGKNIFETRYPARLLGAWLNARGSKVVTGSEDGIASVWDLTQPLAPMLKLRHEQAVTSARFSHDDKRIITFSNDHKIRIWDALTGRELNPPAYR